MFIKSVYLFLKNTIPGSYFRKIYYSLSRKRNRVKYERILSSGKMSVWPIAEVFPTMACNLSCSMCHQKEYRIALPAKDLTLDELKRCIDNICASGIKRIWLIGGEVFVRKDIFSLLDYLRDKRMEVEIATNGMLIDSDKIDKLASYGSIRKIEFSLDGLRQTHDTIRGVSGSFDKVTEAIKLAVEKKKFTVVVTFVLQVENVKDLKSIIGLCRRLKVDVFNVTLRMEYSRQDIEESAAKLKLSPEQLSVAVHNQQNTAFSVQELKSVLSLLEAENNKGIRIEFYPTIVKVMPDELLGGNIRNSRAKLICNSLDLAVIDHNGEVLLCSFIKKSFGNILNTPLKSILNSQEFNDMRRNLLEGNLLPICKYCCALGYVE